MSTKETPNRRWGMSQAVMLVALLTLIGLTAVAAARILAFDTDGTRAPDGPTPPVPSLPPSEEPRLYPTASFSQVEGWIALRIGSELVAVDPDHPTQRLALGTIGDADPIAWSPDGERVLLRSSFEVGVFSYWGLFVLSGGKEPPVTLVSDKPRPDAKWATWGTFSPDGRRVVYGCCGLAPGPYVIGAGGGRPRALVDPCEEFCGEPFPEAAAWSPKGTRIAWIDFVENSGRFGRHATVLSFVDADGGDLTAEVLELPGGGWSLVWSPDGSRLLFWTGDETEPGRIYVIDVEGLDLHEISVDGNNRWPVWSPDGKRIAFVRDGVLHSMAADGGDVRSLGVEVDGAIAWNPVQ